MAKQNKFPVWIASIVIWVAVALVVLYSFFSSMLSFDLNSSFDIYDIRTLIFSVLDYLVPISLVGFISFFLFKRNANGLPLCFAIILSHQIFEMVMNVLYDFGELIFQGETYLFSLFISLDYFLNVLLALSLLLLSVNAIGMFKKQIFVKVWFLPIIIYVIKGFVNMLIIVRNVLNYHYYSYAVDNLYLLKEPIYGLASFIFGAATITLICIWLLFEGKNTFAKLNSANEIIN